MSDFSDLEANRNRCSSYRSTSARSRSQGAARRLFKRILSDAKTTSRHCRSAQMSFRSLRVTNDIQDASRARSRLLCK
jgi:hypothetical protein